MIVLKVEALGGVSEAGFPSRPVLARWDGSGSLLPKS